jgi:hypothetical protein
MNHVRVFVASQNMQEDRALPDVLKKFVAEPLALVRALH